MNLNERKKQMLMQQYRSAQQLAQLMEQQRRNNITPFDIVKSVNGISQRVNTFGNNMSMLGDKLADSSNWNIADFGNRLSDASNKISDFAGQKQLNSVKSSILNSVLATSKRDMKTIHRTDFLLRIGLRELSIRQ